MIVLLLRCRTAVLPGSRSSNQAESLGMDHDWQSADEVEAHFADGGPLVAARRWLTTVLTARDLDTAWLAVDPDLRLVLAQRWLWTNRADVDLPVDELEEVASELTVDFPTHELWPSFGETILDDLGSSWPWLDLDTLGAASRPRMVAIDYELVLLAPSEAGASIVDLGETNAPEETLELLMHHVDDQWLVAGIGSEELPRPGWPPSDGAP
jgi:hypothetical protein